MRIWYRTRNMSVNAEAKLEHGRGTYNGYPANFSNFPKNRSTSARFLQLNETASIAGDLLS